MTFSKSRRFQFTLRTLLAVMLGVAVLLAIWRTRPSPVLPVKLTSRGAVIVRDKVVLPDDLPDLLEYESALRKRWFMQGALLIQADRSASHEHVVNLINLGDLAGFERFSLSVNREQNSSPEK